MMVRRENGHMEMRSCARKDVEAVVDPWCLVFTSTEAG